MSLTETSATQPARPPRDAIQRQPRNPRIPPKVIVALKAIVWEGQELDEAARTAGLTTQTVRQSLAKPHVIQALKHERDVFRAYARAGNLHALLDVRENSKNDNARVAAAKVIEHHADEQQAGAVQTQPGLVVVVVNSSPGDTAKVIEGHTQSGNLVSSAERANDR